MKRIFAALLVVTLNLSPIAYSQQSTDKLPFTPPTKISGYRDASAELAAEKTFLAVPSAELAKEHLRTLTAEPHMAGTPEDKKTAEYVLQKYKAAGLDAYIQEYKVWMNTPAEIHVDLVAPAGVVMNGPSREHVDGDDPYQNDPRVVMAYNGFSPSGDVTADVVYANYGRPEDFKKLKEMGVDLKGKIAVVRYGMNFRGVKPFVASEYGCVGVLIYSDPWDDGYFKGDKYPKGPYRPDTGVQRGSIQYLFQLSGRSDDAGNRFGSRSARQQAHLAGQGDRHAAHSHHAAFVPRCVADPGEPGRAGVSARVAGRVAVHLSRRAGAGEGPHAAQAELPVDDHLRRRRNGEGQRASRSSGSSPATIATRGCTERSIPTAEPRRSLKRCMAWASC